MTRRQIGPPKPRSFVPIERRFWPKVAIGDGCWTWTGDRNRNGYGLIRSGRHGEQRAELAHRVSWRLANGPIPDGSRVLHHCDNPPCVNPAHLWLGSQADNVRDMFAKGRNRTRTRLTPDDIRQIRLSPLSGREIAPVFGISQSNVSRIRRRNTWGHVA